MQCVIFGFNDGSPSVYACYFTTELVMKTEKSPDFMLANVLLSLNKKIN